MMEAGSKTQARAKSKIAVRKGITLQNKENVPNNANKKEIEKKPAKPSTGRKTLFSKKDENSQDKPVAKIKRAKTAPDFAKLHKNWEANFAKGKAVTKRPVTKFEPFRLTKEVNACLEDIDLDNLDVKDEEPVNTLDQKSNENVQEIATAGCSCGKQKSRGEKATTPATTIREFKVPTSVRNTNLSSVKKEKKEENQEIERDYFEFSPDNKALQSILNNDGVRFTPRKTNTGAYCSPSPFNQKRTSIYYTGPRPDRSPTAFEKRLSMRRAAAMMAKMKQPENSFQPSNTLIGVQKCGNRFTTATQFNELENDYNRNSDCIPEETSECNTTHNGDTITYATGSSHTVENEVLWADTLKYYSQSQQENDFSIEEEEDEEDEDMSQLEEEDKEALIAQLEEEVRQTLSNVALIDHTNHPEEQHSVPSAIKEPEPAEIIGNPSVSILLQQSREKPPIYRRLFTSPSHVQRRQPMIEDNVFTPGYLHTASVTRNLTSNPSEMVEPSYDIKPSAIDMAGSSGLIRLPVDHTLCSLRTETGYTTEHNKIPFENCVSFSPSVTVLNRHYDMQRAKITTSNNGVEEEVSSNYSTSHGLQTFSGRNTWVSGPAVKGDNKAWAAKSTFVKKDGDRNPNSDVFRGISARSTINSPGNLSVEKPPGAGKDCAAYTSLVAAATASLKSKLKKRGYETKSAFHTLPHNVEGSRPLSGRNPCISRNEQKILIPTPMKPVVAQNRNRSHEMAPLAGGFISRHRQIMHDALIKSRDHAQEVLLDAEVSLYARNIEYLRKYDRFPRLTNPLAKIFNEGDERHFVPIELA